MAGETYGSPGAAFTGAFEDFLIKQQARKHQELMDSITLRREAREEAADQADQELRKQELQARTEDRNTMHKERELKEANEVLGTYGPGDIIPKEVIDERKKLGLNTPLGPIPQEPANQVPPALAEDPSQTQAITPMAPEFGRQFLGTQQQQGREKLASMIEGGADPKTITATALRLGATIPADMANSIGLGTPKAPHDLSQFSAFGPNGKEIPGVVQTAPDGTVLLNGKPVPEGVTVKRTPSPADPLVEAIRRQTLADKQKADSQEGFSDAAVDMIAEQVAKSGKGASALSGLGWGNASSGDKRRIMNRAAQYDITTGTFRSGAHVDLAGNAADFGAKEGAARQQERIATATAVAAKTASDNLDLASQASRKYGRTDSAWVNSIANQFVRGATSAEGLTDFETKVYTAAREYAKVTMGASASVAGLTDSAAREAEKLMNSAQSDAAFTAATKAMKADMANVLKEQAQGYQDTIGSIRGPGAGGAAPPAAGGGPKRIYYDINGNPVQR